MYTSSRPISSDRATFLLARNSFSSNFPGEFRLPYPSSNRRVICQNFGSFAMCHSRSKRTFKSLPDWQRIVERVPKFFFFSTTF